MLASGLVCITVWPYLTLDAKFDAVYVPRKSILLTLYSLFFWGGGFENFSNLHWYRVN
jgi:hypothetical protein